MAYQLLPDDEYQLQQGQTPVVGGGGIAAGSPDTTPGAAQQPQQPQQPANDGSGKFINFDRYINANRDVAARDASALAGNIGGDVDKASGDLNTRWNQFVTDSNSHGLTDDGSQLSLPSSYGYSTDGSHIGSVQQGLSSRPQISLDEANKRGKATYDGPSGLNDTNFYQDWDAFVDDTTPPKPGDTPKSDTLGERVDATRSATGLGVLSGLNGSSGTRTTGGRNLAGGLMGATGGSAFSGLQSRFGDFLGATAKKVDDSKAMAAARTATTNQLAQGYRDQAAQYVAAQNANAQRLQAAQSADAQRKADVAAKRVDLQTQLTALRKARQGKNVLTGLGTPFLGAPALVGGGLWGAGIGESPQERDIRQQLDQLDQEERRLT